MDKRTIKSVILDLRNKGNSFQDISDVLKSEYNVSMSRQAICGMYKRLTSEDNVKNNFNLMVSTVDIVNYSVIGLDAYRIKDILVSRNIDLSLINIKNTLADNASSMHDFYTEMLRVVSSKIRLGEDLESIRTALAYKGEKPTESVMKALLLDYATLEIRENAARTVAKIYNLTDDKTLVKKINTKFNLDVSSKDLGKIINMQ